MLEIYVYRNKNTGQFVFSTREFDFIKDDVQQVKLELNGKDNADVSPDEYTMVASGGVRHVMTHLKYKYDFAKFALKVHGNSFVNNTGSSLEKLKSDVREYESLFARLKEFLLLNNIRV